MPATSEYFLPGPDQVSLVPAGVDIIRVLVPSQLFPALVHLVRSVVVESVLQFSAVPLNRAGVLPFRPLCPLGFTK